MLLMTMATAPICQPSPFMKNSSAQNNDPIQANIAMWTFLRGDRSTMAPTTGRMKALAIVAKLVRYAGSEPAARGSPSTWTVLEQVSSGSTQPAALPATLIMYGPNSTVSTVV